VGEQLCNVFQKETARLQGLKHTHNLKEELPIRIIQPLLPGLWIESPSLRERLAREPCCKQVVGRDGCCVDLCYVSKRNISEVGMVSGARMNIALGREDTSSAECLQALDPRTTAVSIWYRLHEHAARSVRLHKLDRGQREIADWCAPSGNLQFQQTTQQNEIAARGQLGAK
jgi:hypothetical protein